MEQIACQCGMIPCAHDHWYIHREYNAEGKLVKYETRHDFNRIGHVWVNWKEVARAVSLDA